MSAAPSDLVRCTRPAPAGADRRRVRRRSATCWRPRASGRRPSTTAAACATTGLPGAGRTTRRPTLPSSRALPRAAPRRCPFRSDLFERHPHSEQVFLPMTRDDFLSSSRPTAVASPTSAPRAAFLAAAARASTTARASGTFRMVALGRAATFAMLMWEARTPPIAKSSHRPAGRAHHHRRLTNQNSSLPGQRR